MNILRGYWLADDGRVYSSGRQAIVDKTDALYLAWIEEGKTEDDPEGSVAMPWPRDGAGAQTSAALQAILSPWGLFVDLAAYAASARYAKEIGGVKAGTAQVDTSRQSQAMVANAYSFMQQSGAASTQYKTDSGWVTVTADQMKSIALAVGTHVQACFAAESDLDAKIAAGTVTTTAQIDAAFTALTT